MFQDIIKRHETELEKESKYFNAIGYVKIFAVLLMAFLLYLLFARGFPLWAVALSSASFAGLVVLWVCHSRLHERINYIKGVIAICNRHLARISGEWTSFKDTGAEFADPAHPYACDLDIAGAKSVFQFLNTTHTWHGRQNFAKDLLQPSYTQAEIKSRQEAIAELSRDVEFTTAIQYQLSQIGVNPKDVQLSEELSDASPFIKSTPARFALSYMPVVTMVLLFTGFILLTGDNSPVPPFWFRAAGVAFLAVQAVMCAAGWLIIPKYLGIMHRLPYKLGRYVIVMDAITGKEFSSGKLNLIKSQLDEASEAVRALERIATKLSLRHNALIYMALNILFLWDYNCAFSLEEWKKKYASQAKGWLKAIGELESLVSFSHLPNVCNNTCLPQIHETGKVLTAQSLGHPLLPNASRVNNDISLNNNIFIISGSNMSGKTTFMRTVGVNLVLARAGSFVCAGKMQVSCMPVMTSMRIADDLNEGVSTFYAELTRIKSILDMAQEHPNMMFLLDEIFRGTNSVDRLAGAEAVIERLNTLNAAGIITTHDLELCKLAEDGASRSRIKNYSFSEHYKNDSILFDYKINTGKSQTTNARHLMKMVGIALSATKPQQ